MSEIRLRLRWSGGNTQIVLPSNSSFQSLQSEIQSKTSITVPYQDLRKGYPPASFTFSHSALLSETDLTTGEMISVEKRAVPIVLSSAYHQVFRRIIPADNSCLFNAVAYALEGRSKHLGAFLREVVANIIEDDTEKYSPAILGKPNAEYSEWIKLSSSWGGGIELNILSTYYSVQIGAVSIRDNRIDLFGQEWGFDKVVYVIYDGIHYDVMVKNIEESSEESTDVTVFDSSDVQTFDQMLEYSRKLKSQRQYTDTNSFMLRCMVCNQGIKGESEAREHASATGHTNFCEYSN